MAEKATRGGVEQWFQDGGYIPRVRFNIIVMSQVCARMGMKSGVSASSCRQCPCHYVSSA